MDNGGKVLHYSRMNDVALLPKKLSRLKITQKPMLHKCETGWHWAPPPLPDYDLWYVIEGRGQMELNGKAPEDLHAGVCYLLYPGNTPRVHQEYEKNLFVFSVHFKMSGIWGNLDSRITVTDTGNFNQQLRNCVECWSRGPVGQLMSHTCLQYMLLHLFEIQNMPVTHPVDRHIREIQSAIDAAPARRWAMDELARMAHLSVSQFTRRFRATTGMSPGRYLIKARLSRARQLLLESEMTIAQIADALGYPDVYFFSRQYRAHTGLTPGRERIRLRVR